MELGVRQETLGDTMLRANGLFTMLDRVTSGRIMNNVGTQSTNSSLIHRRSNPCSFLLKQTHRGPMSPLRNLQTGSGKLWLSSGKFPRSDELPVGPFSRSNFPLLSIHLLE